MRPVRPAMPAGGVHRIVLGPAVLAGVTVAALVAGLWLRPDRGVQLLHGAAAVLTGLVLWALTRLVRAAYPPWSGSGQLPASAPATPVPTRLEQLERYVRFSISNGFDCHVHVRPVLRDAARRRLAERHRVDLDRDPGRARALLGEPAWELLAPDRPEPDRTAPGWRPEALAAVIRRVEGL